VLFRRSFRLRFSCSSWT